MASKIKLSKTELKRQRDNLKQYTRFLPTLQLKKQQLQMEIMRVNEELRAHRAEAERFEQELASWVSLFSAAEEFELLEAKLKIERVHIDSRNIAGVDVPLFGSIHFVREEYDIFATASWIEQGFEALETLVELRLKGMVLGQQLHLIQEELRTTTQRVNLFEKVKIPESRENIRVIRIYLGDQQTAAVGRAKIAKSKLVALEHETH